jgi:hypothetical protein
MLSCVAYWSHKLIVVFFDELDRLLRDGIAYKLIVVFFDGIVFLDKLIRDGIG